MIPFVFFFTPEISGNPRYILFQLVINQIAESGYNNFKSPVTLLIISSGAGPNEIQVVVPGAI